MGVPGKTRNDCWPAPQFRAMKGSGLGQRQIGWPALQDITRGSPILEEIISSVPPPSNVMEEGRPLRDQDRGCQQGPDQPAA